MASNKLQLVAGTNITLDEDTTAKTLTISSTGGGGGGSATGLRLVASVAAFKYPTGSTTPTDSQTVITAILTGGLTGSPTFTIASGTGVLVGTGLTRTLDAASMTTELVTVTATLAGNSDTITIFKVRDGATGPTGPQGLQGLTGAQGVAGPQGLQGIQGPIGASGARTYFHVAYASSSDGTVGFNQSAGPYIGTYSDTTAADSLSPAAYTWRLFQGAQGPQGLQGIPGSTGANGQTTYLHLKYSNDGGATFTSASGEDRGGWLGTLVDFNVADSPNPADYTWQLIAGLTGGSGNLIRNADFELRTGNLPNGFVILNDSNSAVALEPTAGYDGTGYAYLVRAQTAILASQLGIATSSTVTAGQTVGGVDGGWLPNTYYVISFWASKSSGGDWNGFKLIWPNAAPTSTVTLSGPGLSPGWQRYAYKIKTGATVEPNGGLYIAVANAAGNMPTTLTGDGLLIDAIKVEQGEVLTAWAPHPADKAKGVTSELTNEHIALSTDAAGNVTSYTGATSTLILKENGVDTSALWTFSKVDGPGVSSTRTGATVVIDSVTAATAQSYVRISAARTGYATVTRDFTISKSKAGAAGAAGAAGQRGSVEASRAIAGSAWSDSEAVAAIAAAGYGAPVILDRVTLYNAGTNFTATRVYDGSAWIPYAALIDGNLIVSGSVVAGKLAAWSLAATQAIIADLSVSTLKIANQAVTVSASGSGFVLIDSSGGFDTLAMTAFIDTGGAPLMIFSDLRYNDYTVLGLYINGTLVKAPDVDTSSSAVKFAALRAFVSAPAAGTLTVQTRIRIPTGFVGTANTSDAFIYCLGTKK